MPTPTRLASPFWVVLVIFTVIRLVAGAKGVPYENPRIAAVSILTLILVSACLTSALARGLVGLSFKDAVKTGALIGLYGQAVIFTMTMVSIAAGIQTYFNYAGAINERLMGQTITFAEALPARGVGLVVGPIEGAIGASIGWVIGAVMNIGGMKKKA